MNTIREKEILEEALAIILKECAPKCVFLFGSRAKGTARPGSDFDFAVDCLSLDESRKIKVGELLEAIAGLYSINIVYINEVDEGFKQIILDTGEVLYEQK